ncbi:MAG: DUF72 domain-containing protein [Nitrospiraceae bacterium]|nr:DUF72 domain-containing protein [Nitrospiraceae bacterium]
MPARGPINIGCSGFSYDHWRGVFYPEGLAKSKWLGFYTRKFSTVELNVTFYRLPRASTFMKWHDETPPGFRISVKGSRFITHVKRLKDPREPLGRFFERIRPLDGKMAVVLWQLPPTFKADIGRLEIFAEELAPYEARNAFEFREESWVRNEKVIGLLSKKGFGLCMADWPPFVNDLPVTADFVYIRRHGHGTYGASYSRAELEEDARRIRKYSRMGKEVFIYFNNDIEGYAPRNAEELKGMLE